MWTSRLQANRPGVSLWQQTVADSPLDCEWDRDVHGYLFAIEGFEGSCQVASGQILPYQTLQRASKYAGPYTWDIKHGAAFPV